MWCQYGQQYRQRWKLQSVFADSNKNNQFCRCFCIHKSLRGTVPLLNDIVHTLVLQNGCWLFAFGLGKTVHHNANVYSVWKLRILLHYSDFISSLWLFTTCCCQIFKTVVHLRFIPPALSFYQVHFIEVHIQQFLQLRICMFYNVYTVC